VGRKGVSMKKWTVKAEFIIQTDTRGEAWTKATEMMEKHFRGLIAIRAISLKPLTDPDDWIALNEPIRGKG